MLCLTEPMARVVLDWCRAPRAARSACPAWVPGHDAVVQLHPVADPPPVAGAFAFWSIPGHKQLLHDGKGCSSRAS